MQAIVVLSVIGLVGGQKKQPSNFDAAWADATVAAEAAEAGGFAERCETLRKERNQRHAKHAYGERQVSPASAASFALFRQFSEQISPRAPYEATFHSVTQTDILSSTYIYIYVYTRLQQALEKKETLGTTTLLPSVDDGASLPNPTGTVTAASVAEDGGVWYSTKAALDAAVRLHTAATRTAAGLLPMRTQGSARSSSCCAIT